MDRVFWLAAAIFLVVGLGLMVAGIRAAVRAYESELRRSNVQLEAFLDMLANIRQMPEDQKKRA